MENFLSLFRDWDIDPPVSHKNLLCELATGGMQLDWPATKSPVQGNTVFEIFYIFAKTKDFPKIIKTLKNLFVFNEQNLSMWKTFNQVQSHKWIWHSLNIDMCDVYEYQKWDSPKSNVKLKWSIQLRHTQLPLGRVTHLNYRNMHLWPPTKLDYIVLKLFIWLHSHHNIWSFWINTSHFEIDAWNF